MKILYVSQYFPPEMAAPAARVAELSCHWARAGHDVTVLTGFPNHPTGKLPESYRKKLWRIVMRENFEKVKVVRTWLLPFPNRRIYGRIVNHTSFCVSAALAGLFVPRPDVIIATSPQLLVGLCGWWLSLTKRVPFVFEVRDLWPESLLAVGMGNQRSLIYRILAAIASFLYRRCDLIVVVTPAFKDYLVAECNVDSKKIVVVQNGVETDVFNPHPEHTAIDSDLELEDKFVVSYIGTVGMAHGLDKMIETASQLRDSHPEISFLLVGEGAEKEKLKSKAASSRLTNVRFVDEQPRDRMPGYICASDVCLVLLKKSVIFRTVIPTKMLECMSCARPVVLGVEGQASEILNAARAGISIQPENVDELTDAIIRLAGDPASCSEFGRNGRQYVLQHFSRPQTARMYLQVLESLLEKKVIQNPVAA